MDEMRYLRETPMLDYTAKTIQSLIENRRWRELDEFDRIRLIYDFVRDDILFGYNISDEISASRVLADGYGQCNTKGHCLWRFCGQSVSPAVSMALL